jgi:hypothetical protein
MRRGAPAGLRLDPAQSPPIARIVSGPRGLRLERAEVRGADVDPIHELSPIAGVPFRADSIAAVASGRMALVATDGVAASVGLPEVQVVHDRRPPGLDAIVGAAGANAGLLRVGGAWRAVVLPSLGDLVADLGTGPVAIRGDGRRVAHVAGGAIVERAVPDGEVAGEVAGAAEALCFTDEGALLAASGGAIGPPGLAPGDAPPITTLVAAAGAPRACSIDAAGAITVWDTHAFVPLARLERPVEGLALTGMSPEGDRVVLCGGAGLALSVVLRTSTGRVAAWIDGARGLDLLPDDSGIVVCGDFGVVLLNRPREAS